MAWRFPSVNGSTTADPPLATGKAQTVQGFTSNPAPTIVPQEVGGAPITAYPGYMVAGVPYPKSAQQSLGMWDRSNGNNTPVPFHSIYNSPRNRLAQT